MGDLQELIERLEKLDGPSREVDAEIDIALFGGETVWKQANYTMESYPASRRPSKHHVGGFANEHVPLVTASLDAAIALCERVLPGCYREVTGPRKYLNIPTPVPARFRAVVYNATGWHDQEPIALVLATLRALEAQGGGKK